MFRRLFRSRGQTFELVHFGPGWPSTVKMAGQQVATGEASGILMSALTSPFDRQALQQAAGPLGSDGAPLEDEALVARLLAALVGGRVALCCVAQAPCYRGRPRQPPQPSVDPDDFDRPPVDQSHWVEVVLVDAEGRGISGQRCRIVTPDGVERSGYTDSLGSVRIDRLPPGDCKVAFPDLPAE